MTRRRSRLLQLKLVMMTAISIQIMSAATPAARAEKKLPERRPMAAAQVRPLPK